MTNFAIAFHFQPLPPPSLYWSYLWALPPPLPPRRSLSRCFCSGISGREVYLGSGPGSFGRFPPPPLLLIPAPPGLLGPARWLPGDPLTQLRGPGRPNSTAGDVVGGTVTGAESPDGDWRRGMFKGRSDSSCFMP